MADQKNIQNYIYLGLSIIIFLVAYFLIYPAILEIKNTQKDILVLQKTLEQKQSTLIKFKDVSEKYKAKKEDFQKISQMLSEEPDIIFQLIQFEALADQNGMIMEDISFENWQADPKSKLGVLPLNLKVSGSYSAFKNYLGALAQNLNLIDVEIISFQSPRTPEEVAEKGYTFSLKVNTYTRTAPTSSQETASSEEQPIK
ncbi:MAG TPA: type 4a pilus biogenesis protein PilO [Candidatus Pacearchaeota archaeon]|nr:type 4a pilus biogenesis protein PilO [Candidatus Pacearchaeota archaeon]HOK94291.1 type 4a pilus biogenesis protein PilO [Candidatus Pacearchaeota archaeon]HPO75433.1 type 4a pilus biogenesis protein PilO [Candidatus Pacearchaeota archaeon]